MQKSACAEQEKPKFVSKDGTDEVGYAEGITLRLPRSVTRGIADPKTRYRTPEKLDVARVRKMFKNVTKMITKSTNKKRRKPQYYQEDRPFL